MQQAGGERGISRAQRMAYLRRAGGDLSLNRNSLPPVVWPVRLYFKKCAALFLWLFANQKERPKIDPFGS